MSDMPRVGIEVVVDATQAETGLSGIDSAVVRTGRNLSNFATTASSSLDRIGDTSQAASSRVENVTRNLIGSVQRTTAAMEAGSRSSREYFESLAARRGANLNALRPYLDQLDAVVARQRAAGVSAGQLQNALRGVPAQITDIVVALQGGQAPLTVLLQQGGQLRDMFGSIGGAASGLASVLARALNPITLIAIAAVASAVAYNKGSKEADAYTRALVLNGNAAATTADQLTDMARSISQSVGTQGAAAEALAALAGTGKVSAASLRDFGLVAVQTQRAIGQSVQDTAADFAALAKAPVEALEKLEDKYHFVTASLYEQVKALQAVGRVQEAGEIAQGAYSAALDQRNRAIETNLGTLERTWRSVGDAGKWAWNQMLNIGRAETIDQQLEDVAKKLAAARARMYSFIDSYSAKKEIADLLVVQSLLQSQQREQSKANEVTAEQNRLREAGLSWQKQVEQFTPKWKVFQDEYVKVINLGQAAGASQEEILASLVEVQKKYSDVFNEGVEAQIAALERRGAVEEEQAKRAIISLSARRAAGSINEQDFINAQADRDVERLQRERRLASEELALSAGKINALKEQLDLRNRIHLLDEQITTRRVQQAADLDVLDAKRERDAASAYADAIDAQTKYRDELAKELDQQNIYIEQIGLGKEAMAELTAARLDDAAAAKEGLAASIVENDANRAQLEVLRDQARLLRDLAAGKRTAAVKEQSAEAAKQAAEEWKRSAQQIENSLTDALMRGFESGKGPLENLRDTAVNMFKTLILRPTIQAVMAPVAATLATALPGPAAAAVTGANALGAAGNIASLVGAAGRSGTLFGGGLSVGNLFGSGISGLGNAFGASSLSAFGAGFANAGVEAMTAAEIFSSAGMAAEASAASLGAAFSAALPWVGGAVLGYKLLSGLFDDGPEKNTRLTFASNNTPGNISINERGNEGRVNQAYIDGWSSGAFGSFGLSSTFWMDGRQEAVQSFIQTVTKVDDALSVFLTEAEKARASAAVTGKTFTANTGAEGDNPNAKGQLDKVFADRLNAVFEGVAPGLSALINNFKGSSQELATEAASLLQYRTLLQQSGDALFGATVTLQDLAALRLPSEATSAALQRVTNEFTATNAVVELFGRTSAEAFGAVGLASEKARAQLVTIAGGADKLTALVSAYAQNYLTEAERNAIIIRQNQAEMEALGLGALKTKDQFKAMVQQLVDSGALATEEGAKQFQKLMAVATNFGIAADAAKAAADAATAAALASEKAAKEAAEASEKAAEASEKAAKEAAAAAIAAANQQAAALIGSVDSAYGALEAIVNRQRAGLQTAYEAQVKVIDAQIKTQNEALAKYQSLSNSLRSTLDQLRPPGQQAYSRLQAQSELSTALAIARAGGPLPDADKLQRALSVLTQDASAQFASYADYLRDVALTANDVAALSDLTDKSLSIEERTLKELEDSKEAAQTAYEKQLEALQATLDQEKQQIDVLKGMDTSLLTIADGIEAVRLAILAAEKNSVAGSKSTIVKAYQEALGRTPDDAGLEYYQNQAASGVPTQAIVETIKNSPEARIRQLYKEVLGRSADAAGLDYYLRSGASHEQIRAALMNSEEYTMRLRGFAVGTNYVPENMPALIHKGERIIPAADNRELLARLAQPAADSQALVQELRELRRENKELLKRLNEVTESHLYAIAKNTMRSADEIDNWNVNGLPPERESA